MKPFKPPIKYSKPNPFHHERENSTTSLQNSNSRSTSLNSNSTYSTIISPDLELQAQALLERTELIPAEGLGVGRNGFGRNKRKNSGDIEWTFKQVSFNLRI